MEEMFEQFHHLLQPIRDLEQNWSVDLAEELTQAFHILTEHGINHGMQGEKVIDFGKAALLIQGGAHVYSKKVDYLHKTVCELKEWMAQLWEEEKKKKTRNQADSAGNDDASCDADEQELDLLDLDDLVDDTVINESTCPNQVMGSVLLPPKPSATVTENLLVRIPLKGLKGDIIGYLNEFALSSLNVKDFLEVSEKINTIQDVVMHSDDQTITELTQSKMEDADPVGHAHSYADSTIQADLNDTKIEPFINELVETPKITDMNNGKRRQVRENLVLPKKVETDPWSEMLDPHTVNSRKPKRLNPGNGRVLPPSLRKGSKRSKAGTKVQTNAVDDIVTFCNKEYDSHPPHTGSSALFPEMRFQFAELLKQRLKAYKSARMRLNSIYQHADGVSGPDEDDDIRASEENDYYNDCDENEIPYSNQIAIDQDIVQEGLPDVYYDQIATAVMKQIDDLAYDKLSEIDQRVKKWEGSIRSVIDEVEQRPAFDMLHYSNSIFSSFPSDENSIHFDDLFKGKPKYEAYRMFVSTLILANHGNIDIVQNDYRKDIQLALLNKTTLTDVIGSEFTTSASKYP